MIRRKPFIGTWDDYPVELQDNEYLREGYRVNFNTYKEVFYTLFRLHNESVNVCSHLCGAIVTVFMIVILLSLYPDMLSDATQMSSKFEGGSMKEFIDQNNQIL